MHKTGSGKFKFPQLSVRNVDTKYFNEAMSATIDQLTKWYSQDELLQLVKEDPERQVFYYPTWDVYFNGYGTFLVQLTIRKRILKCEWDELPDPIPDFDEDDNQWSLISKENPSYGRRDR